MAEPAVWWLYMIECRGGGIYTGIALDVDRRYAQHASGRGAIYTKINPPGRLLYREAFSHRRGAAQMEYVVKAMTAAQKIGWAMSKTLRNSCSLNNIDDHCGLSQ